MEYMVSLNDFADGALAERFNEELQKILENIADPNTDPKKNRTLTIQVNIHGDDRRDVLNSNIIVKSKLLHSRELETKLLTGVDGQGNMVGKELKSGAKNQMFIDNDGEVAQDDGEKIEAQEKVLNFREQRK